MNIYYISIPICICRFFTSNDIAQRGQVSILSEKSDEMEDDNETVVGFDYTDEEYDQNDDYDTVPPDNNAQGNNSDAMDHDFHNSGYEYCFFSCQIHK